MEKILFKKTIAAFLVFFILSSNIVVYASDSNQVSDTGFSKAFIEASDDTIVCYMWGVPVPKSQIDENSCVKQEYMDIIQEQLKQQCDETEKSTREIGPFLVPSGYNDCIVKTTIVAPQYAQYNTTYYLSRDSAAQFASGVETSATSALIAMAAGFIPHIGPAITICFTFSSLYKANVASQIRDYSDYGNKVQINEARSKYGTFYGVFEWVGRVCYYKIDEVNEFLDNLQYK